MAFAENYFSKQQFFYPHISEIPSADLNYAVVIPSFYEENIIPALDALWDTERPDAAIEVIVVINEQEGTSEEIHKVNIRTCEAIENWKKQHEDERFKVFSIFADNLPIQHAGVGLARKIGMDEAVRRFNQINNPNGFIFSFDADCVCDRNYFTETEAFLKKYPQADGFNFYFEHPLAGIEFPEEVYQGIIQYELHLRYYIQGLRYAGFPHAFHTIGSCYAVRASTYVSQGGMNRRKSGEDFYFLHKIIPLGNFYEINTTRVLPSPRPSMRVPFGTGPAVHKYLQTNKEWLTYNPRLFEILRAFFSEVHLLFRLDDVSTEKQIKSYHSVLITFLDTLRYTENIKMINANSSSVNTFIKRFFRWFNALQVLRFLNYASEKFYRMPVNIASVELLKMKNLNIPSDISAIEVLKLYREMERQVPYFIRLPQ